MDFYEERPEWIGYYDSSDIRISITYLLGDCLIFKLWFYRIMAFPILGMLIKDSEKKKRFERFENVVFILTGSCFKEINHPV